ncbi:type II toxin-antitoxin system HicB family antitoxin [Sebaldella sp. S0638]|uniref:type II toxin-antitoxin system HicB family antitoxin n=1 Tax=Sebaldella sp. S0638 TaxID=2957809 RepID=UPI00209D18CB|nr:type II toxin-antitoxin system HicB family antitoxin [Sebaldella sp. S0638]MCP1224100.1 type II toxin-antitoxin system HicB family antitoxin [Sebaldella sp. S0638]
MARKDIYIYPAIFEEEDGGYNISFPNLEGALTCGDDLSDSLFMAKDVLGLYLYTLEEDGTELPEPSLPNRIKVKDNQFVQLIEVYMPPIRDEQENRHIRKNVTISKWVNDLAVKKKINFSAVLESALKEKLGYRK